MLRPLPLPPSVSEPPLSIKVTDKKDVEEEGETNILGAEIEYTGKRKMI